MKAIKKFFTDLAQYPSAIASLVIIILLLAISAYALIKIPYKDAIRLWRGGEDIWYATPKNVPPSWTNLFRRVKLPDTIHLSTVDGTATKTVKQTEKGSVINIDFKFDYPYDKFPQELTVFYKPKYTKQPPFVSNTWLTPDGRTIRMGNFAVSSDQSYRISQDNKLQVKLGGVPPQIGLLAAPNSKPPVPLKGSYTLNVSVVNFEKGADMEAEFVLYGEVYGIAGTDHLRRDLSVALLWGLPVALAFGLAAALGTTITTMVIAAVGVWFGGWVDDLIQRITEVNLVLPFLPILIMIGTFYSRSIWVILGVTILLSIFGAAIKTYRAIFLQIREAPYIEAARAYGASSRRIILNYLVPRIVPLLIPQLVTQIPAYVFLEASLAVLGLGDPVLPTWGKVIQDALYQGALFQGLYYWVLEPAFLLMVTGLAFAMLGFALDRIFNPRLRGV
jgi:peptide/nickel transport system permease protein